MPVSSICRPVWAASSLRRTTLAVWTAALGTLGNTAHAQVDPYIGQQILFAGNFCPQGWLEANGQVLPIAQYAPLFALVGTTYGGDGVNTFSLPDLRGRTPIGAGNGPGLTPRTLGQAIGSESTTLTVAQLPAHSHTITASKTAATHSMPTTGQQLAASQNAGAYVASTATDTVTLNATFGAGSNQPIGTLDPYLTLRWCIAVDGIFPSRN